MWWWVEQLVFVDVCGCEFKFGSGGLCDVEFVVQLLQLVYVCSDELLWVVFMVDVLVVLGEGGYIGCEDVVNMIVLYEFFRLFEY